MLASLAVLYGLDGHPFEELFDILESVRSRWRAADSTYSASLALMLFAEARRQEGASKSGNWPGLSKSSRRLPAWVDSEARELARALLRWRSGGAGWTYGAQFGKDKPDLSNSQFAVRALLAAANFGAKLSRKERDQLRDYAIALQSAGAEHVDFELSWRPPIAGAAEYADADRLRVTNARDRGFRYAPLASISASRTTSALVILASLRELEFASPPKERVGLSVLDPAIVDGLAWLAKRHAPGRNIDITSGDDQLRMGIPGIKAGDVSTVDEKTWSSLVLWNLSQVMDLLRIDGTSLVDWYRTGAEFLIERQERDGRWRLAGNPPETVSPVDVGGRLGSGFISHMDVCDTAFAILFLRRMRDRLVVPAGSAKTGGALDRPVTPK